MLAGRASPLSLSDLAPGGVYLATPVSRGTGALLPHRFTLTASRGRGGLLSVARAVALRAQRLAGTLPYGARTFLGGVRPRDRMVRPAKENPSTRRGSATSRSLSSCGRDPTGPHSASAFPHSYGWTTMSPSTTACLMPASWSITLC